MEMAWEGGILGHINCLIVRFFILTLQIEIILQNTKEKFEKNSSFHVYCFEADYAARNSECGTIFASVCLRLRMSGDKQQEELIWVGHDIFTGEYAIKMSEYSNGKLEELYKCMENGETPIIAINDVRAVGASKS